MAGILEDVKRRIDLKKAAAPKLAPPPAAAPEGRRLNFSLTEADKMPPPVQADPAPRPMQSPPPAAERKAPGFFASRAEKQAYGDTLKSEAELKSYRDTNLKAAERRAAGFNEDASQLNADADRAAAEGRTDLEKTYRTQAQAAQKKAEDELSTTTKNLDQEIKQSTRRASRGYDQIIADKMERKAARGAKVRRGAKLGAGGLLLTGMGIAGTYAVDAYVKSQAIANAKGATDADRAVADVTTRAVKGEVLSPDDVAQLRETVGDQVFESLMDLNSKAREAGVDPTEDDDIRGDIKSEADDNSALIEQGYDPRAIDDQVEMQLAAEEYPDEPGMMSAQASGLDGDNLPPASAFNFEIYQALVESGDQAAADSYADEALAGEMAAKNAEMDAGYDDFRTTVLNEIGATGMADRLNEGGDVLNPEGLLGKANSAVQGLQEPVNNVLENIGTRSSEEQAFEAQESTAKPRSIRSIVEAGGDMANGLIRGDWMQPATEFAFGSVDVGDHLNQAEDVARTGYKLGDLSGLNDAARTAMPTSIVGPDGPAGGASNETKVQEYLLNQQRQEEMDQFNQEERAGGSAGMGIPDLTFDDLLQLEASGNLGFDNIFDAANAMGVALPYDEEGPTQPGQQSQEGMYNYLRDTPDTDQDINMQMPEAMGFPAPMDAAFETDFRDYSPTQTTAPTAVLPSSPPLAERAPPAVMRAPGGIGDGPDMDGADGDLVDVRQHLIDQADALSPRGQQKPLNDTVIGAAHASEVDPSTADYSQAAIDAMEVDPSVYNGTPPAITPEDIDAMPSTPDTGMSAVEDATWTRPGAVASYSISADQVEEPNGPKGDFKGSQGVVEAGLVEDAEVAEKELNWINRQLRDKWGMDEDQRHDFSRALIAGGAAMANTPGNFLQGFTQAASAGIGAMDGSKDKRTAAETAAEQTAYDRQQDQFERQRADALAKAQIAEMSRKASAEKDPSKIREMDRIVQDNMTILGMSYEKAYEDALNRLYSGLDPFEVAAAAKLSREAASRASNGE